MAALSLSNSRCCARGISEYSQLRLRHAMLISRARRNGSMMCLVARSMANYSICACHTGNISKLPFCGSSIAYTRPQRWRRLVYSARWVVPSTTDTLIAHVQSSSRYSADGQRASSQRSTVWLNSTHLVPQTKYRKYTTQKWTTMTSRK